MGKVHVSLLSSLQQQASNSVHEYAAILQVSKQSCLSGPCFHSGFRRYFPHRVHQVISIKTAERETYASFDRLMQMCVCLAGA